MTMVVSTADISVPISTLARIMFFLSVMWHREGFPGCRCHRSPDNCDFEMVFNLDLGSPPAMLGREALGSCRSGLLVVNREVTHAYNAELPEPRSHVPYRRRCWVYFAAFEVEAFVMLKCPCYLDWMGSTRTLWKTQNVQDKPGFLKELQQRGQLQVVNPACRKLHELPTLC